MAVTARLLTEQIAGALFGHSPEVGESGTSLLIDVDAPDSPTGHRAFRVEVWEVDPPEDGVVELVVGSDVGAMIAALVEHESTASVRGACPDDGTCHHGCPAGCFRVTFAGPLSGVYPGDRWPADVRDTYAYKPPPKGHPSATRSAESIYQAASQVEPWPGGLRCDDDSPEHVHDEGSCCECGEPDHCCGWTGCPITAAPVIRCRACRKPVISQRDNVHFLHLGTRSKYCNPADPGSGSVRSWDDIITTSGDES